jgi:hypothetical protein
LIPIFNIPRRGEKQISRMDISMPARNESNSGFDYDVFISYRTRLVPDASAAEELQRVLESFPVPRSLRLSIVAPRFWRSRLKAFRDLTDLASSNLEKGIEEKLSRSRFLLIVCTLICRNLYIAPPKFNTSANIVATPTCAFSWSRVNLKSLFPRSPPILIRHSLNRCQRPLLGLLR